MASPTSQKLTKITAKLYAPMYADFDRQLSDALLRRDAFLDRMISQEIPQLREDLRDKRLSPEANRFISGELKRLGGNDAGPLRQVSISVRHETAQELRAVVEEHNLVRDAFLNRLIAFLRSSDKFLGALKLPKRVHWGRSDGTEDMPTSPMRVIDETLGDPFYYLRAACEERHGCGLHLLEFPPQLLGLYCYLEDDRVPGTPSYLEREETNRRLLADLDDLEASLTPINIKGA